MNKLLLILGVSGVGKSSIIKELLALDSRFVYIVPYTTRPSRGVEDTKVSISNEAMDDLWSRGELLSINEIYGIRCGTPRSSIVQALEHDKFPVLDWPLSCLGVMEMAFLNQFYAVYVIPPSIEALRQRLAKDGRDTAEHRLLSAREELRVYESSRYIGICNLKIVAEENQVPKIAYAIYTNYLQILHQQP